jgi:hypothetical protein
MEAQRLEAGALSIGPFEGSRWRLRRTRQGYGDSIDLLRVCVAVFGGLRGCVERFGAARKVETGFKSTTEHLGELPKAAILSRRHTTSGRVSWHARVVDAIRSGCISNGNLPG